MTRMSISNSNLDKIKRPFIQLSLKEILKNTKGSQPMQNILKKNECLPTCLSKWENVSGKKINIQEFNLLFALIFTITKDTNLQWFQYRIIHRILGTNELLYKINYKDSPNCCFCKTEAETLEHLLWKCKFVSKLILDVATKCNIRITMMTFLLGSTNFTEHINLLIIYLKKYIFYCKTKNCTPNFENSISYLKFCFQIESNARSMFQNNEFQDKWHEIKQNL